MCTRHTTVLVLLIAGVFATPGWPAQGDGQKIGPLARERALRATGSARVSVQGAAWCDVRSSSACRNADAT
jgi:hypothetical protein